MRFIYLYSFLIFVIFGFSNAECISSYKVKINYSNVSLLNEKKTVDEYYSFLYFHKYKIINYLIVLKQVLYLDHDLILHFDNCLLGNNEKIHIIDTVRGTIYTITYEEKHIIDIIRISYFPSGGERDILSFGEENQISINFCSTTQLLWFFENNKRLKTLERLLKN